MQPPTTSASTHRPAVLGIHANAGVSKKTKRGRKSVLSTRARARHDRGLERAEAVVDRTATKIQKSKYAASLVETRKKGWDEINAAAAAVKGGAKMGGLGANMFAGLAEESEPDEEEAEEWVDELDDDMAEAEPVAAAPANKTKAVKKSKASKAAAPAAAVAQPLDDDVDIL